MIQITHQEKEKIQKANPRNNIKQTGHRKKSGSGQAFLLESDMASVDILARLHGYKDIKYTRKSDNKEIFVSAGKQLLKELAEKQL